MRSLGLLAAVLAFAGCNFTHGAGNGDGSGSGSGSDGGRDAPPDMLPPDAPSCEQIVSLGVNLCPMDAPATTIDITGDVSLNTMDGMTMPNTPGLGCASVQAGGTPDVCLVYARTITIDAGTTLLGHGGRPLVLWATTSIDVEGAVDVASHINGQQGAGPMNADCMYGRAVGGAGGGQGGSFGTMGGNGGNDSNAATSGGLAGAAIPVSLLVRGCDGKDGAGSGGSHGQGGGVVLLVAPQLTIGNAGAIDASGAAGGGAKAGKHGGGGSGSGGMIVLDAGTIALTGNGQIYANGGHGGGGSDSTTAGSPGSDPTDAGSGGGGGGASGSGGDGAAGAFGTTAASSGNPGTAGGDGGGGGGGGAGYVFVHSGTSLAGNANVSPPVTTL